MRQPSRNAGLTYLSASGVLDTLNLANSRPLAYREANIGSRP